MSELEQVFKTLPKLSEFEEHQLLQHLKMLHTVHKGPYGESGSSFPGQKRQYWAAPDAFDPLTDEELKEFGFE